MLPVRLADQLQPGTFEYTVNYLVSRLSINMNLQVSLLFEGLASRFDLA